MKSLWLNEISQQIFREQKTLVLSGWEIHNNEFQFSLFSWNELSVLLNVMKMLSSKSNVPPQSTTKKVCYFKSFVSVDPKIETRAFLLALKAFFFLHGIPLKIVNSSDYTFLIQKKINYILTLNFERILLWLKKM